MSLNYSKAGGLLALCLQRGESIAEVALAREIEASQKPREEILARMEGYFLVMRDVGRRMPRALKETGEAGLAATPSALGWQSRARTAGPTGAPAPSDALSSHPPANLQPTLWSCYMTAKFRLLWGCLCENFNHEITSVASLLESV